MATTKIWAVKDNLERTVNYAANPKKTVDSDLKKAIHYAGDEAKTESRCYVTGVNCNVDSAFEEMNAVQERFGKQAQRCLSRLSEFQNRRDHAGALSRNRCRVGQENVGQRVSGAGSDASEYRYAAQSLCRMQH